LRFDDDDDDDVLKEEEEEVVFDIIPPNGVVPADLNIVANGVPLSLLFGTPRCAEADELDEATPAA
jgi:hypothetical protein